MPEINTNDQNNVVPIRPDIELPAGAAVQPDHMLPEGDHLAELPPVVDAADSVEPQTAPAAPTEEQGSRIGKFVRDIFGPAAEVANANKPDNRPPQPPAA